QSEDAHRNEARRWRDYSGREAKETGASRGLDDCAQAEPGTDRRQEEAGRKRGARGRCGPGPQAQPQKGVRISEQLSALSYRPSAFSQTHDGEWNCSLAPFLVPSSLSSLFVADR